MKQLLIILTIFCLNVQCIAQHTISGKVIDENGNPISQIVVNLTTIKKFKVTNENGSFIFFKAPDGPHQLTFKSATFQNLSINFELTTDTTFKINLQPKNNTLNEVIVLGNSNKERMESPQMGVTKLTPKTLNNLPSIGEKDVIKALTLMPGVKTDSEGSASIYVRGGSPDQNLMLLNSSTIYQSNHAFGFLSTFNSDALSKVELWKGSFPARYGGRLSSVLEIETKTANMKKIDGNFTIGLLSSKFITEIPLKKEKISLMIAGRRSYLDLLTYGLKIVDRNNERPKYSFYDFNTKLTYKINSKNILNIYTYSDKNIMQLREESQTSTLSVNYSQIWENNIFGFNLKSYLNSSFSNEIYLSKSSYKFKNDLINQNSNKSYFRNFFFSGISSIDFQNRLTYHFNDKNKFLIGLKASKNSFVPGLLRTENQDNYQINSNIDSLASYEFTPFIENEINVGQKIKLNLGLRYSNYFVQETNYSSLEPRFTSRYLLNNHSSLKLSFAKAQQQFHLLSNPGLGIPVDLWFSSTKNIEPQKSFQYAIGFDKNISTKKTDLYLNIEAYYKEMNGIISYKDGYSSDNFTNYSNEYTRSWENTIARGKGYAYGFETFLEKSKGDLKGWISYTLAWIKHDFPELNNGKSFFARYDRRNDFSIVGTFQLTNRWSLGSSWVFATGQAITLPINTYTAPSFDFNSNQFTSNNSALYTQGERNSYRMKSFHRLDLSIKREIYHRRGTGTLDLSFYNLYNRKNPYYYYLGKKEKSPNNLVINSVSLLPTVFTLSYTYRPFWK